MRGIPTGFELRKEGDLRLLLRSDVAHALAPLLRDWSLGALPRARPLSGGRGGVCAFDLGGALHVVLRPYRRGGLVRRLNRDLYLGIRPRPLREVAVAEVLRARAVPTVEALGAAVRWMFPALYRGALVTREMVGARNLWEYMRDVHAGRRAAACRAAAEAARRLHDAGAIHPDLNLQNFLVVEEGEEIRALIIDLDRVRLRAVTADDRRAAFDRLCRSIRRLDPTSAVLTFDCVQALHTIAG